MAEYNVPRSNVIPSVELQKQVFPFIERLEEECTQNKDPAFHSFMEVLKWLRLVVLQDAAMLKEHYPLAKSPIGAAFVHPLWSLNVFKGEEFRRFQVEVIKAETQKSKSEAEKKQSSAPMSQADLDAQLMALKRLIEGSGQLQGSNHQRIASELSVVSKDMERILRAMQQAQAVGFQAGAQAEGEEETKQGGGGNSKEEESKMEVEEEGKMDVST